MNVTFKPGTSGTSSGILTITDNASGGQQTVSLSGTGITPSVVFAGSIQQPVTNDGNGHFVATVTVKNQGNVTVDSAQITLANTKLGTSSAISASGPIAGFAPGGSAKVTLTFPITSALSTATSAPLKITGTYSTGTLSGNWTLTFRSVTLGTSIIQEN